MRRPRWQALVSLCFVGCMLLALLPMGCSSVTIYHYPGSEDQPHVPESTEQRLKQCVEELKDDINAGSYSVDAKVNVNEGGYVVGVETEGMPNPNVGACMRIVLQGMRLPQHVLGTGMLRTSASATGEKLPDRGQIGEIVTITVVTIVFTEIVIEAVAITIGVTVTATVASGVANAFAENGAARQKEADEEKRCREVKEKCLVYCSGSPGLPAPGGGRFRRCMRECMAAEGCSF